MIDIKVLTIFLALNPIDLYVGRIINGEEAKPHRFPFQILLMCFTQSTVNDISIGFCSGSIISNQWILTAAHCIDKCNAVKVFLGLHDLNDVPDWKTEKARLIAKDNLILHPNYGRKFWTNDIALIKVPEKIEFTNEIKSIDLPLKNEQNQYHKNETFIASGWGRISDRDSPLMTRFLQYIEIPLLSKLQCLLTYPDYVKKTNICAQAVANKSICSGDSGGPLIYETKHGSKQTLIGITSGFNSGGCQIGMPSVFTEVSRYLDWISKITGIQV